MVSGVLAVLRIMVREKAQLLLSVQLLVKNKAHSPHDELGVYSSLPRSALLFWASLKTPQKWGCAGEGAKLHRRGGAICPHAMGWRGPSFCWKSLLAGSLVLVSAAPGRCGAWRTPSVGGSSGPQKAPRGEKHCFSLGYCCEQDLSLASQRLALHS